MTIERNNIKISFNLKIGCCVTRAKRNAQIPRVIGKTRKRTEIKKRLLSLEITWNLKNVFSKIAINFKSVK
jgi:hypothetical protein